jgi:glutamyl-Q tRNA(Asp) synthetase
VTRGRDLVDATDVHVLLQRLLGRPTPAYAHHRLVLDDAGERMAKRAASTTVRSLREAGRNPQDVLAEATRRLEPG